MPDENDLVEVPFPVQGIDVSVEYDRQPPGTTPIAVNVRTQDVFLNRLRGGSRAGLIKFSGAAQIPAGSHLIQNLTQLVDPRAQLVIGSVEDFEPDFVPDPRNPARSVPPEGSGEPQVLGWPPAAWRRVQVVPGSSSVSVNASTNLNMTLTDQPANTPVPGSTSVLVRTIPAGRVGDGTIFGLTNGVGSTPIFDTNPEKVLYLVSHTYTEPGFPFPLLARGVCQVTWTPDLQISLTSPDGTMLPADGKSHSLVATLTKISNGAVVSKKLVQLFTIPSGEVGYGDGRYSIGDGTATFTVSDVNNETVIYQVFTPPPGIVASNTVSIQWGPTPYQFAHNVTLSTGVVSSATIAASFTQSTAGHLIVVGIVVSGSNGPSVFTIADSLGTAYTQVNTTNDGTSLFGFVWTGKPTSSGANTITVTVHSSPAADMAFWLEIGEYSQKLLATPAATKAAAIKYTTPVTNFFDDAGQLSGGAQMGHVYVGFVLWQKALVTSSTFSQGFTAHDEVVAGTSIRLSIFDSVNPSAPIAGAVRPTLTYTTSIALSRGDLMLTCDFAPAP